MAEITRRSFIGTGSAASGFAIANIAKAFGLAEDGIGDPPARRPMNVLLLMADQHRQRALGVDRDPVAKTPNLDSLANTSVRFDSAYCTDPLCVPSRASLLTGLYVHNHLASGNATPWPFEHKTVAHYFSEAGYMTALIGKMHFVDAQTHGFDYHLDFNDWFQYLGPKTQRFAEELADPNSGDGLPQIPSLWQGEGDPWTGYFKRDDRQGLISVGRISSLTEEDHFESFVTRESIRFLKNYGKKRPFFLVSSFLKPHDPFMPAERFAKMFHAHEMILPSTWGKVDLSTVPRQIRESIEYFWICPEVQDPEKAKLYMAMYYANLAQMDDNVGRIIGALHELGLDENTVVVYTSDHGEMLGAHGLWQKMVFYEPSIGVPLMFRVPGMTVGNVRCATPVSLVQVLPTLADLCRISTPSGLDGTSLATDLRDPSRARETTIFAENDLTSPNAGSMIRQGNYKYCHYENDTPELYDLSSDPEEMKNLASLPQFKEKSEELQSHLLEWHSPALSTQSGIATGIPTTASPSPADPPN